MAIVLVLVVALYIPGGSLSMYACDCNTGPSAEVASPRMSEDCFSERRTKTESKLETFLEKSHSVEVSGYRCEGMACVYSSLCDIADVNYVRSPIGLDKISISERECENAAQSGVLHFRVDGSEVASKVVVGSTSPIRQALGGRMPANNGECGDHS